MGWGGTHIAQGHEGACTGSQGVPEGVGVGGHHEIGCPICITEGHLSYFIKISPKAEDSKEKLPHAPCNLAGEYIYKSFLLTLLRSTYSKIT